MLIEHWQQRSDHRKSSDYQRLINHSPFSQFTPLWKGRRLSLWSLYLTNQSQWSAIYRMDITMANWFAVKWSDWIKLYMLVITQGSYDFHTPCKINEQSIVSSLEGYKMTELERIMQLNCLVIIIWPRWQLYVWNKLGIYHIWHIYL